MRNHGWDLLLFGFVAAVSTAFVAASNARLGATFDEPLYLREGLLRWQTGSYDELMKRGTMPLPVDVATLPLYLSERFGGVQVDLKTDYRYWQSIARATMLPFWWMLLGFGMLIGRQVGGPWGGRFALLMLACEPNLLAHAGLATTDVPFTACMLAFGWQYARRDRTRWISRVLVPGLLFGVCLLAKASALAFVPLTMLAVEIPRLIAEGRTHVAPTFWQRWFGVGAPLRRFWFDSWKSGAIGLVLAFAYAGSDWKPEPTFVAFAQKLPPSWYRPTVQYVAENLCIFTNLGEGVAQQIKHNRKGHHGVYLFGVEHTHTLWYYFPAALAIKLPIVTMIGVAAALVSRSVRNYPWPFALMLLLLLFSLNCRVQIGVRLVLPLVAFATVVAGLGLHAWASAHDRLRPIQAFVRVGVLALLLGTVWSTARQFPHGLMYVNEYWQNSGAAHRLLSDSNYDWGQGLPDLDAWRVQRGLSTVDVWYFGADPAVDRPPFRHKSFHHWGVSEKDFAPAGAPRLLAVSVTNLYGSYNNPNTYALAERLRGLTPVDRTPTFFIFDLSAGAPPKLAHRAR